MATDVVKQIRKATRRKFTAEEKIRVVLEGLRGETPISEICRRHSIPSSIYYKWSKAFLDAGKNGLTRDTQRDATTDEVRRLKEENASLKTAVAETILENQRPKKVWACSSAEVSAYDCRIEIGSITSRSRNGIAGEAGPFSTRHCKSHLLSLATEFPPAGPARVTRPTADTRTHVEPDSAGGTRQNSGGCTIVSRLVTASSQLSYHRYSWVFCF